jgi:putative transposase
VLRDKVKQDKSWSANSITSSHNMFRISRFQEVMQGLPRPTFDRWVESHQADKYSKGFGCWDQLLVMVYGQLAGVGGLRELEAGFNGQRTHHYHLGTGPVRRSTLADANANPRKVGVFAEAARALMSQAKRGLRREVSELLYALDATAITLKGPGFDSWTGTRTRCGQGIKLHVQYAVREAVPCHASFTAANVNDRDEGVKVELEAGATYVFDKAYCDYNWWAGFDAAGARFVTRFKTNAALRIEKTLPVAPEDAGVVLEDQIVHLSNRNPGAKRKNHYTQPLRRVVIARPDHDTPLMLATNDLTSPARDIARLYQDRWQVELFFKWIKQHLKIKRFLGRSQAAVHLQILTALITYLLLALYRTTHRSTGTLWNLLAELRATLFQRPTIEADQYRRRRDRQIEFSLRQPGLFL